MQDSSDSRSARTCALVEVNEAGTGSQKDAFCADDSGSGNFAGSVANLLNSAIGAGLLGIPFAHQCSGAVLGCILLVLFGLLTAYSLHIIGRAQQFANANSYQLTVKLLVGPKAEVCIIVLQLMFLIGGCIGFLDIIPDQLMPVVSAWAGPGAFVAQREFIICAVVGLIILPLMFVRNIQALWPLATFSVIAIIYTSAVIVVRSFMKLREDGIPDFVSGNPEPIGSQISWARSSTDIIKALPIFCFAYNVHTTYPLVFAELNAPKQLSRMDRASGLSLVICAAIYIMCGTSGYFYGVAVDWVQIIPGDCLKMFPSTVDVTIARFCIAISVIASYTTLHFSARICLEDLFKAFGWVSPDGFTNKQRVLEVFAYVAVTVAVSMVVTELDAVLGVVGSVAVIPFMFVFPGMLQMKIDDSKIMFSLKNRFNGLALIVLGISMAVSGFVSSMVSAV